MVGTDNEKHWPPIGWAETTLGMVSEIQTGPFGSQLHEEDYVADGIPIITVEHLVNGRIDISSGVPMVSETDKSRLGRYHLQTGDIVFSRVGSVDRCGYVSSNESGWLFSGRLLRVRPVDKINKKFVYYWLSQPSIKSFVRKSAVGATMPSINTDLLKRVPISIPPIHEQDGISEILSGIDDKIELLRKQNETLERTAQAIYHERFGKYSVDDELPEGWKMGKFKDLVSNVKTPLSPENNLDGRQYVPIDQIPIRQLGITDNRPITEAQSSLIAFEEGDILFGAMRSYFHRVSLSHFSGVTRTTTMVLRPIEPWFRFYSLLLLNEDKSVEYANSHGQGTTMPYAVWNNSLENMPTPIPTKKDVLEFDSIASDLFNRIVGNIKGIQIASEIRDTLLPRLMSGKIRINP